MKYPAGAIAKTHTHPKANGVSFILEGESKGGIRVSPEGLVSWKDHGKTAQDGNDGPPILGWPSLEPQYAQQPKA